MISKLEHGKLVFICPGCDTYVYIPVTGPNAWGFNGNVEKPTLTPSVLQTEVEEITDEEYERITAGETIEPRPLRCHCFIKEGMIEFLSDCTHALAGQTVPMVDW